MKSKLRKSSVKADSNIQGLDLKRKGKTGRGAATTRVQCETELGVLRGSEESLCLEPGK